MFCQCVFIVNVVGIMAQYYLSLKIMEFNPTEHEFQILKTGV